MENEEKEDLLLEVTESEDEIYEKEEIDYYIEKKILDYIQNEKPDEKSRCKTLTLIATCFFMFISSSVLIILLPIYIKYSSVTNISTYSKLVTLSLMNCVFFIIAHVIGVLSKCGSRTTSNYNLSLGDVLKISFLLSISNILIFWLTDGDYVSCHLKDPLKGSSVAFSLLFYFVFSRKMFCFLMSTCFSSTIIHPVCYVCLVAMTCDLCIFVISTAKTLIITNEKEEMSLERTFCAITIIVGVFISVDFGICDKFQCNGNSNLTEVTPKFHFLYVIFYILAHGIWVLHFTFIEVSWTTPKRCSSNLNVSVLSNVSSDLNTENSKPSIQSLSLICQEEQEEQMAMKRENISKLNLNKKSYFCSNSKKDKVNSGKESDSSINNSVPSRNQFSVPDFKKFPLTSTPNNESSWHLWTSGQCYDVALWQHLICCLLVMGLCWLPTLSVFNGGKSRLLVDVLSEVIDSIKCHLSWENSGSCNYLQTITVFVSVSYVMLMLSSIKVLKITQSAVTVISVMMAALPVGSLFWSLFRLDGESINILQFNPEITGEAVCAVLGFPIIGIGLVLLIKSHIREFFLVV